MHVPRSTLAISVGLALAALAPATAIADQDLRSPDARDAAARVSTPTDLRSPDARDAAQGRSAAQAPTVMVVRMPQGTRSNGLDWGDAGIGAGGVIALVALGSGASVLVRRRRGVGPVAA
jgi:hypothetical protein